MCLNVADGLRRQIEMELSNPVRIKVIEKVEKPRACSSDMVEMTKSNGEVRVSICEYLTQHNKSANTEEGITSLSRIE